MSEVALPAISREQPLLEVTNLIKHFPARGERRVNESVRAVDGVSFILRSGETLGLVGESGGGKTTVGLSVLRLVNATGGTVMFGDQDVLKAGRAELKLLRREMQMIFQDPLTALDPRRTVGASIAEGLRVQRLAKNSEARIRTFEMLDRVGLDAGQATRYPHEFSGGQLQRVGIARALVVDPKFIVCDEPVSALDVSIRAQIINLLIDVQKERQLAMLFIAHDLGLVRHISDRVAVMYLGKVVETADTAQLYEDPLHPYTRALLSAIPDRTSAGKRTRIVLSGETPSPSNPPSGCRFRTRCPDVMPQCAQTEPELKESTPGHWTACLRYD